MKILLSFLFAVLCTRMCFAQSSCSRAWEQLTSQTPAPPSCGAYPFDLQIDWHWYFEVDNLKGQMVSKHHRHHYRPRVLQRPCRLLPEPVYRPATAVYEHSGSVHKGYAAHTWKFWGLVYNEIAGDSGFIPYGPAWGCKGLSITQSVPTSLSELGKNNPGSNCKPASPIIIDAYGEGFHLTDVAHGVLFYENLKLPAVHLSWTDPNYRNGWLALPMTAVCARSVIRSVTLHHSRPRRTRTAFEPSPCMTTITMM